MKNIYPHILAFFIVLISFIDIRSQQHFLKQYNVSEGLPQSEVKTIFQDNLGYLWAGTSGGGVARFDGSNFKVFNENDGLDGNIINSITEGENNTLYFASTWGAISVYKNEKISSLNNNETSFEFVYFNQIDKHLYASKKNLLFKYKANKWHKISFPTNQKILDLKGNESGMYILTNNDIFKLNEKTNSCSQFYYSKKAMESFYITKDNTIYFAIDNNIYFLKNNKTTIFNLNKELNAKTKISKIQFDKENNLWFLTRTQGVFNKINNKLINISTKNGLQTDFVLSLFCDNQNNTWIGTSGEGLLQYSYSDFVNYSNIEGLKQGNNFAIQTDYKNRLWVGSSSDGCFVYDGQKVINYTEKDGLPSNKIRSITKDNQHNIWIGTNKGLVKFNNGLFSTITTNDGLVNNYVNSLLYDNQNRLWVCTTQGISIIKNGKITNYTTKNGLPEGIVYSIFEDRKGIVWLGTNDGLIKHYEGGFRKYGITDGLCNSYIGSITEDQNGIIWVGTDRCISKLVGDKFIPYTDKDGLNSSIIYLMDKDKEGNIWVGTNKGLDKITIDAKSEISNIQFYGKDEGFFGIECNSRGSHVDKDGNLYFATIKGIFKHLSTANKANKDDHFPLYINDIELFLNPLDSIYKKGKLNAFNLPDSIVLPANKNHLKFSFLGLDLTSKNNVYYSYKLNGFDSTWVLKSKESTATYSNIPPGNYIFKVKAFTKDSTSSPEEVSTSIIIKDPLPPFYLTWWFILLTILFIISLIYNLFQYQTNALRISKKELEKTVKERTAEITIQNNEKSVLLQEIHHRVKNNLQIINSLFSIQSFYTDNEEIKALFKESQNRILSMSKIHKTLYESKDFAKVNVKEYISELVSDIKESYAINRCDLNLNINDEITIGLDQLIPFALITNEIISNSFKYAFVETENNTITVNVEQTEGNKTSIFISDNGQGLPDSFDWDNPTSMGVDLIKTLTEQLDGNIDVNSSNQGTNYLLTFIAE